MEEIFSIPGAGGIIEKEVDGEYYVLIQNRFKTHRNETGLLEIPAGKIRAYENIYTCLRREVEEETGLSVTWIEGEVESVIVERNNYRVLQYEPFSSCQNMKGDYPIMVQVFICKAEGVLLEESNESKDLRWMKLSKLKTYIETNDDMFYPMHITTLKKYIKHRGL